MKNQKQLLKELLLLESTLLLALRVLNNLSKEKIILLELQNGYLKDLKSALKQAEQDEDFETCIDLRNKINDLQNGNTTTAN
jgi:protein-arginine kinase activator protein McsA